MDFIIMKIPIFPALIISSIIVLSGCKKPPYEQTQPVIKHHYTQEKLDQIKKSKPANNIKKMTLEEAFQAKEYYRAVNETELLIKTLERITSLSTDHQVLGDVKLELADLNLKMGNLEVAQKLYKEYRTLFPGSEHIKHACYQEVLANYWDTLDADRDQTKTQATITLGQNFLEEFPNDDLFAHTINDTLKTCYTKLLDSELHSVNFYLNKYNYSQNATALNAAQNRLAYIKKELLPHLNIADPRILTITAQIAQLEAPEKPVTAQTVETIALALGNVIHGQTTITIAARDRF